MKKYGFSLIKAQISFRKISQLLNTDLTSDSGTQTDKGLTASQVSELKKKLLT